ncbi:MAG: PAAR domain-containing protein, partial [Aestuariivirgaceae bacterium]
GGSSNVFINGKPAVTAGDKTSCGGVVVGGNSSVIVNGKPLAGAGSTTSGCAGD